MIDANAKIGSGVQLIAEGLIRQGLNYGYSIIKRCDTMFKKC